VAPGLRATVSTVFVLGVCLGLVPWQMRQLDAAIGVPVGTLLTYGGAFLFVAGAGLLFAGAYYLKRRGEGAPLAMNPPRRMVVAGPYAYLQHPMLSGFLAMALGEALWLHSPSVTVYAVLLGLLTNVFAIYVEEPRLEKRFGEDYRAYQEVTPRWLPFGGRAQERPSSSAE
jgi:protein-S-isoprenylcysteine O-methyltransferase Ste14